MPRLENAPPFRFAHEADIAEMRQVAPQDEDMRLINKFALQPQTREQVAIFRMDLVNNQIDRHYSRFPERELNRINKLIVGKPVLEFHNSNRHPRGLFFRSQLVSSGQRDAAGSSRISVRPDFYMLRTFPNKETIDNINGGIYRGTSIGFQFDYPECSICNDDMRTCAHRPGYEYDVDRNGKRSRETCHYIMHDVTDVYEGSLVPVPSQRTEIVEARAFTLDNTEILDFGAALDIARREFHEPIEVVTRESEPEPEEDLSAINAELTKKLRDMQREDI